MESWRVLLPIYYLSLPFSPIVAVHPTFIYTPRTPRLKPESSFQSGLCVSAPTDYPTPRCCALRVM